MEKQLHFSMCDSKCRVPSVCHLPSSKVHDQERMLVGDEKHCQPPEHGMLCTGPDTCMTFQHHLLQLWRALLQAPWNTCGSMTFQSTMNTIYCKLPKWVRKSDLHRQGLIFSDIKKSGGGRSLVLAGQQCQALGWDLCTFSAFPSGS